MTDLGPMLNFYPDGIGGKLSKAVDFLEMAEGAFSSVYILPSMYHSDLDRGFCVVDYDLNEELAADADLERLRTMGLDLKLDIVLNHASVQSPQFQDLLKNGKDSADGREVPYWNTFYQKVWEENGKRNYLGQMDLNIQSPMVWEFYERAGNMGHAGQGKSIGRPLRTDASAGNSCKLCRGRV